MAETVQTLFYKARALLDEYSDDGTLIPDADVADMQGKFILLADMAQKEINRVTGEVEILDSISLITDTIQINDVDAQAIVYYGAARLAPFENKELVTFFESKYEEMKKEAKNNVKVTEADITDAYVWSGDGGW